MKIKSDSRHSTSKRLLYSTNASIEPVFNAPNAAPLISRNTLKILNGCNVLMTRPAHQAQPLSERITTAGGNVVLLPTIEIIPPLQPEHISITLSELHQYDIAIFVSANAVHAAMPHWHTPTKPLKILAIGHGTANQLLKYSIHAELPRLFNSEGLLQLPVLQHVRQKRILIFAGADSRPLLANCLKQRGADVFTLTCYRRQKPTQKLQQPLHIDIIVSSSGESLRNLYEMVEPTLRPWLLNNPILVINSAMAAQANDLGFKDVTMAENAHDEAVFKALTAWYSNK